MIDGSGSGASSQALRRRRGAVWRFIGVTLATLGLLISAAIPAAAAELMRVTFVRHGESEGNLSGYIDTSTPGPVLTAKGQQQAHDVVGTLGDNNYDAVYASTMVRTQLTAAPMSAYLGLPIQVIPGIQEVEAGVFEGDAEDDAADGYGRIMVGWAMGNLDEGIPGSIDGHEFDARVDGALQTIYDNGDRNPVVFSHGAAIMFWTMMNVDNLTFDDKMAIFSTGGLDNTDYVVIEGNNEDGWTLVSWNGQEFSPEPTLGAEVRRQLRTLNRQLQGSLQSFVESFASRDLATIATAFNHSVADAVHSIAKYHRAVNAKIIHEVQQLFTRDTEAPVTDETGLANREAAVATAGEDAVEEDTAVEVTSRKAVEPETADVTEETVTEETVVDETVVDETGTEETGADETVADESVTEETVTDTDTTDGDVKVDDDESPAATTDDSDNSAATTSVRTKKSKVANSGTEGADAGDDDQRDAA